MAAYPAGYVSPEQMASEIERAKLKLGPEVIRVKYTLEEDTSGEPAIYFRITVADSVFGDRTRPLEAAKTTRKIREILFDELRPNENWGRWPYFRFRSQSEQAKMHDPEWA